MAIDADAILSLLQSVKAQKWQSGVVIIGEPKDIGMDAIGMA